MNPVYLEDLNYFKQAFPFANELEGSTFLITGATGLLGSIMISCLLHLNRNIHIIAPVRNIDKAKQVFTNDKIDLIECDLQTFDYNNISQVDYVIHFAAPTSSRFFVDSPVETTEFILESTIRLLHFCKRKQVKAFLLPSSLEVYGELDEQESIYEEKQGYLSPLEIRSSYPMAKRQVENLCVSYAKEYGIRTLIARLTQTTGAGVSDSDNRVIVQFTRKAIQGDDLVLHTTGLSSRPYIYTIDAIIALLYILLRGQSGDAYNVANEETYISARDLAVIIRETVNPSIQIKFDLDNSMGYAPVSCLRLSATKLMSLGWLPRYGIRDIILRLKHYIETND